MKKSEVPIYLERAVRSNAIRQEELLLCLINAVEKQIEQQERTNELLDEIVESRLPYLHRVARADRRLMKEGE